MLVLALVSLAVACGSDDPSPTATSSSGGQQPTVTTVPATAEPTATNTPAPTPTGTQPTVTPGGPATATPVITVPTNTAVPTNTPSNPSPAATSTPVPAPTNTPAAVPDVKFTPGVPNTVELPAGKDNTLYQSSIGATSNGSGTGLFVGKTNNNSLRRALVWFDIASVVPSGSTIESVEMRLTMNRTATGSEPVLVHRVTSDWGEGPSDAAANEGRGANADPGDVTWLHTFSPDQTWRTEGGDFESTASAQTDVQGPGSYTWDSTAALVADVQSWIDEPGSNFGWVLLGDEANSKTAKRFGSRESSEPPVLVITFTPPN